MSELNFIEMVLGSLIAGWSAANAMSGGRLNKFVVKHGSRILGKGLKMAGRALGANKDTTNQIASTVGAVTGNKDIEKGLTSKKKRGEIKASNPDYYGGNPNHRNTKSNFTPGKDVSPKISLENQTILR
jgi:hypothetical protein